MTFLLSLVQFMQPGILLPALAVVRPTIAVIALAIVVGLVTRPVGEQLAALRQPVVIYTALFVLVQVVSMYRSGLSIMMHVFENWLPQLAFVALGVFLASYRDQLYRFVWGMILGCQFITFYGIYALIADLERESESACAYGTYGNHNDYTYAIILILPFLYFLRRASTSFLLRALLAAFMGGGVLGIFLSLSRGGMIGLVFEVILLALMTGSNLKKVLSLIVLVGLGLVAIQTQYARRAAVSANYTAEDAETSRYELWRAGKNAVIAHPILGIGSNQFREYSHEYGEISHDNRNKNTHNTFLEVLVNNGLVGFAVFLLFLRSVVRELRGRAPLVDGGRFEAIRLAALVSLWSLLFRGLTNAKPHEFGFYALAMIAGTIAALRPQAEEEAEDEDEQGEWEDDETSPTPLHAF
jgi:O-antigen ligase